MKVPHIAMVLVALAGVVGVRAASPTAMVRADESDRGKGALVSLAADEGDAKSEGEKTGAATAETEGPAPPLPFDPDLAIFTAVVFLLLLAVLTKFAWRPIVEGLNKRERSIADQIDEAHKAADKANESLRQYEARLAAAEEEVRQMLAAARRDADVARDRMIAEARAAADKERQRALDDIRSAKNAALNELAQKSVDAAIELAGRVVERELKPADHAQLIRQAVEQFPSRN
jgi:F-type H+-transporting ATPase subunit b